MINTSLLEQMRIDDREIALRKKLFGFTEQDVTNLVSCKDWIAANIDKITETFYQQQVAFPEIAAVIGDQDTLQRLKSSMRFYVLDLFQGYYDAEYVNRRLRVGKVHKQIGVTPKLYLSAIWSLMSTLDDAIYQMLSVPGHFAQYKELQASLHKLILFDTQLVFDTYINSMTAEIQIAKNEIERYAEGLEAVIAERTQQLQEQSTHDSLTKLLNQRAFYDGLRRELSIAERLRSCVCLVYIDLNDFKKLNDSLGHQAGDHLLVTAATAMRMVLRNTDLACRYGGDEFCIILPNTNISQAELLCQRLIESFDGLTTHDVTFSIGIAQSGPDIHLEMNEMVKLADAKMYQAKELSHAMPNHHINV